MFEKLITGDLVGQLGVAVIGASTLALSGKMLLTMPNNLSIV